MEPSLFEKTRAKRSRILVQALIISGTLNFALLATFITVVLKERRGLVFPVDISSQPVQEVSLNNQGVLEEYFSCSFEELVKALYDETHVEQGYRKCDLALSCLVTFHSFDIERALPGFSLEKRQFAFVNQEGGEEIPLILYPGIDEERLKAIKTFARIEVWPLTSFGLYQEVCASQTCSDSLKEAFFMTAEAKALKKKLRHLPYVISDENVLELIKLSGWENLRDFTLLPQFLVPCIEKESKLAAYLLIHLDREFALKQLDNTQIETLIPLLTEKTPEVEAFLNAVAVGIRPEHVREKVGKLAVKKENVYVVQQGDSLWKISRLFNVEVEMLRMLNSINSDQLQPGTRLVLPLGASED